MFLYIRQTVQSHSFRHCLPSTFSMVLTSEDLWICFCIFDFKSMTLTIRYRQRGCNIKNNPEISASLKLSFNGFSGILLQHCYMYRYLSMLFLLWRGIEGGPVDQYLDTLCDQVDSDRESTQMDAHIKKKPGKEGNHKELTMSQILLADNF